MHPHWRHKAKQPIWRTVVKTVVYRIVSATSTILIAGLMFGNWTIAGAFGLVDLVANTLIYFSFERVWGHLSWRNSDDKK